MGCFMGCFGLSSNKKRRNSIRKILPRDQRICSYEPLLSSDPTDFSTVADNPEKISKTNLRCEVEEAEKNGTKKTRKRVRFNLNVQTYEPILPTRYQNCCSDDEEEEEKGEISKGSSWKAVKAKPVRVKQVMKENVEVDTDDQAKPLLKEIVVNTSLSTWLASPKSFHGIGSSKRSPFMVITNM
ncbi:unnamed protein product [Thlaspi arvense]|uniref:Uncharacterized protein n=1 Tax=Thlaspi arvense TaxID=13288 RepID=A0AAU9S6V8_THLAR|nr:unnamed protein product [Thlaspi arvense]